jgi:hypothetical protein
MDEISKEFINFISSFIDIQTRRRKTLYGRKDLHVCFLLVLIIAYFALLDEIVEYALNFVLVLFCYLV